MAGAPVSCLSAAAVGTDASFAFASAGAAIIKLWTATGKCIKELPAPAGTTPSLLVALHGSLEVVFRQARPFDRNAFRLVPTSEEGRRRRAADQAAHAQAAQLYDRLCKSVSTFSAVADSPLVRDSEISDSAITAMKAHAGPATAGKEVRSGPRSLAVEFGVTRPVGVI